MDKKQSLEDEILKIIEITNGQKRVKLVGLGDDYFVDSSGLLWQRCGPAIGTNTMNDAERNVFVFFSRSSWPNFYEANQKELAQMADYLKRNSR